jgi:hypothetical protein
MPAHGAGGEGGRGGEDGTGRRIGIRRRIPFSQCHFDRTVSGIASSFDKATALRSHFADLGEPESRQSESKRSTAAGRHSTSKSPIAGAKEAEEVEKGLRSGQRMKSICGSREPVRDALDDHRVKRIIRVDNNV